MISSLKKGSEIELEIESLAFGAKGLARLDGYVVFVENALPGQRVRALLTKKKRDYAEARVVEVLRQSPDYVAPRCSHFHDCGGCLLQDFRYAQQLEAKRRQVEETLIHLGGIAQPEVAPVLGSPQQFFYRNKMEFSFARQRWLTRAEIAGGQISAARDFALGLHARNSFDKTLDLEACYLFAEVSNDILRVVRDFAKGSGLLPYTTRDHSGFWRFLVMREGKRTNEFMLNFVTAESREGRAAIAALSARLVAEFPIISTIVHNINRSKAQIAFGEEELVLQGSGFLRERLGDCTFRISANSFFQTNTLGAEQLYHVAREFAALTGVENVYDLYCGAGTIAIFIARQAKQVVGFEIVPEAIHDASVNCSLNEIANCHFVRGDLKDEIARVPLLMQRWGRPDVIIADPPRAGMHPKVLLRMLELAPQRIVYVSCNPATFARDVRVLCQQTYRLEKVQPVDMFPHTAHCEVVGLLVRRELQA